VRLRHESFRVLGKGAIRAPERAPHCGATRSWTRYRGRPPDAHQSLEATALLLPDAHTPAHRAQQCTDVWWQVETEGQGHLKNRAVLSLRANQREFLFCRRLSEQGLENDITSVTRQHFGGTRVANQCLDDFLFRLRMPVDRTPPDIKFAVSPKPGLRQAVIVNCFAAAATLSDGSCGVRESRFVGL